MKRTFLFLLLLAMAAGLAGGLYFTWVLYPVEYYDTAPDDLYFQDQFAYLSLIGDLYVYEGDLARAQARLAELDVPTEGQVLVERIEAYLDGGGQPEEARNLARLAADLGASGGVLVVFAAQPTVSPQPSSTTPTQPGLSPTPRPTPTPAPSFRLVEQTALCAPAQDAARIVVWVEDVAGNPLPGIEVVVSWDSGQDRFFTGLRPAQGAGYADFEMTQGIDYNVSLANYGGDVAQGLVADLPPGLCQPDAENQNWRLIFRQVLSSQ
jgi:hypothetical protein